MNLDEFREYVANLGNQPEQRGRPRKEQPPKRKKVSLRSTTTTQSESDGRVSRRQQAALGQTNNDVRAIYVKDSRRTPLRRSTVGLTLAIGGSCEDPYYHHGRRVL